MMHEEVELETYPTEALSSPFENGDDHAGEDEDAALVDVSLHENSAGIERSRDAPWCLGSTLCTPQFTRVPVRVGALIAIMAPLIALVVVIAYMVGAYASQRDDEATPGVAFGINRIAFGSCTSYHHVSQVWVEGVIPSAPDAWIWMGDMSYMDDPNINCDDFPTHSNCNCTADWLHIPPHGCNAGNLDHATLRMEAQLQHRDYQQMLEYMCPGYLASGNFPPAGGDPQVCPRPILGVYDDHDFTWNNGNGRLPQKYLAKQIFLDAIGVPRDSPRRAWGRGIEWQHTLNAELPGREVDVFLLDGRYHRDELPCEIRGAYCKELIIPMFEHGPFGLGLDPDRLTVDQALALRRLQNEAARRGPWCVDLVRGGDTGDGSCCAKDSQMAKWCAAPGMRDQHPALWQEACNASAPEFGQRSLVVKGEGGVDWAPQPPDGSEPRDMRQESPFCEMLGGQQRRWLEEALRKSNAPLKLVVSGSVVLGSATSEVCADAQALLNRSSHLPTCACSSDEWDCYRPAQQNLLATLARTTGPHREGGGCAVILTGDFHWSDIKVLRPGPEQPYSETYQSTHIPYPIFQVMASGLTNETGQNFSCSDYRLDPNKLRNHPECDFVRGPSFGMVEIDWISRVVRLQVRNGHGGDVALQSVISLDTCLHT
eukprot:CAMPEP_0114237380 /NCGR_PEP_ID=MMETSP0058-20121206/7357_1 /TAXON_ID=36894 /ORGANISM="Pyramimonas parkeae, CCMP726" /LENGTH=654 /DNA_ID=CAMNT_0001349413 /DNA_START=109 /DNA_END=2073 /DNA_ORIENTATION=+